MRKGDDVQNRLSSEIKSNHTLVSIIYVKCENHENIFVAIIWKAVLCLCG